MPGKITLMGEYHGLSIVDFLRSTSSEYSLRLSARSTMKVNFPRLMRSPRLGSCPATCNTNPPTVSYSSLSAIVSGDAVAPRAMFLDPSGLGISVQRGDHVSKADALVVRIAPDRVFFNIEEDAGSGKTRTQERVIELHAGELAPQ